MKAIIFYSSTHHGNTKKVAKAMGEELGAEMVNVDKAVDVKTDVSGYDLIGFGSGIYAFMHSMELIRLVRKMKLKGKKVFVFSTSASGKTVFHGQLKRALAKRGAELVGEFACQGWVTWAFFGWFGGGAKGKPDEADLKRAREFAKGIG
jgi:flavodoxin